MMSGPILMLMCPTLANCCLVPNRMNSFLSVLSFRKPWVIHLPICGCLEHIASDDAGVRSRKRWVVFIRVLINGCQWRCNQSNALGHRQLMPCQFWWVGLHSGHIYGVVGFHCHWCYLSIWWWWYCVQYL